MISFWFLILTMVLLDLSAAFDTCLPLSTSFSTICCRYHWCCSSVANIIYLSDRQQFVRIDTNRSRTVTISRGVPQGSVLGPLLFLVYVLILGQIIRLHGLNIHSYADDIQIYFAVQQSSVCPPPTLVFKNVKPGYQITEILLVVPKSQSSSQHDIFIDIDGVQIRPSTTVPNLGVLFNTALRFDSQIVKSCEILFVYIPHFILQMLKLYPCFYNLQIGLL